MHVILLAGVDTLAQGGRERMVLVQHDGDLAVAFAEHDGDVAADQGAQALFGVGDGLDRGDDPLLGDVHGVAHQVEEDFVLALEMVVKPAFT